MTSATPRGCCFVDWSLDGARAIQKLLKKLKEKRKERKQSQPLRNKPATKASIVLTKLHAHKQEGTTGSEYGILFFPSRLWYDTLSPPRTGHFPHRHCFWVSSPFETSSSPSFATEQKKKKKKVFLKTWFVSSSGLDGPRSCKLRPCIFQPRSGC